MVLPFVDRFWNGGTPVTPLPRMVHFTRIDYHATRHTYDVSLLKVRDPVVVVTFRIITHVRCPPFFFWSSFFLTNFSFYTITDIEEDEEGSHPKEKLPRSRLYKRVVRRVFAHTSQIWNHARKQQFDHSTQMDRRAGRERNQIHQRRYRDVCTLPKTSTGLFTYDEHYVSKIDA